jgi:hypothetical protein
MADEQDSGKRLKANKTDSKKSVKKVAAKKSAAKRASRGAIVVKKAAPRKPVPIKKARVGKRAVLPPLPPPTTLSLKATRSPVRRVSRVEALLRNKGAVKTNPTFEIAACTEAALREKLRLAAPYVELWLSRHESEAGGPTPEAAFVRIWQWLTLEARLDDRRIVTGELIQALFAEEARSLI